MQKRPYYMSQALSKDEGNYSFEVLQKAGDAHYFNTNMEQAYKWYTILYDEYEEEMSADNIFKLCPFFKRNRELWPFKTINALI